VVGSDILLRKIIIKFIFNLVPVKRFQFQFNFSFSQQHNLCFGLMINLRTLKFYTSSFSYFNIIAFLLLLELQCLTSL